ncbi:DUF58 domain-containing protein [Lachnospiraceae bacterium 45-W7]
MWKKILYLLGIAGIFYLSVLYRSRALLTVCGAALLLMPFFLCILYYVRQKLEFELLFFSYPQTDSGDYLVGLRVKNPTGIYLPRVRAKIKVINMATGKKRKVKVSGKIPAEAGAELTGKIRNPQFGIWQAECRRIRCYEWMNLWYLSWKLSEKKQVMIFPGVYETNIKIGMKTRLFWSDGELYHPQMSGDDPSETLKLREYQKGDRLNRIHWKLSAKSDSLIVAEMSMPAGCNVVWFLSGEFSRMKEREARCYWEVVNSISQELLNQECAHYLVWQDKEQQQLCRKAIRKVEDLADFWCGFSAAGMGIGAGPEAYARAFYGDSYASWLAWNEKLELSCNDKFLVKMKPERVRQQLAELEILL